VLLTWPRLRSLAVAPDAGWYALGVDGEVVVVDGGAVLERFGGRDAVALDGRRLVYAAPGPGGVSALWCRRVGGAPALVVAPPGGVGAFAVDGASVVYTTTVAGPATAVLYRDERFLSMSAAVARGRVALARVPLGGGEAVPLPGPPAGRFDHRVAAAGGRIVAAATVDAGDAVRLRLLLAVEGGWLALGEPGLDHSTAVLSPDGRRLACRRLRPGTRGSPPEPALCIFDLDDPGVGRAVGSGLDLSAAPVAWGPGGALYYTADRRGHRPIYRLDGGTTRLTTTGAYSSVQPRPGGVWAIRAAIDSPPVPVRLSPAGRTRHLTPTPATAPAGRLERVSVPGAAGWLCRPRGGGPTPLLVWTHGGPRASWTGWSWRWNPLLATARGYAVLLADPAGSTGYGPDRIRRGWADWTAAHDDVDRLAAEVSRRPDIDADRLAIMGSSYGGYLVYQALTRTDRYRAGVSHAGIWDLRAFVTGSLLAAAFRAELGHPVDGGAGYAGQSPRERAAGLRAPLLVSHGGRDTTVPLSESLTLWTDLRHLGKPVTFLHLPGEGHELTRPATVALWWDTAFGFLDATLHGRPWTPPAALAG
jgi:dipeptidyl aminopeptidase/acylaminoacyl peptidase